MNIKPIVLPGFNFIWRNWGRRAGISLLQLVSQQSLQNLFLMLVTYLLFETWPTRDNQFIVRILNYRDFPVSDDKEGKESRPQSSAGKKSPGKERRR